MIFWCIFLCHITDTMARGRTPTASARKAAPASPDAPAHTAAPRRRSVSIRNKSGFPEDIISEHLKPRRPHHTEPVFPASIGTPPTWITVWLIVSALIVTYDALYVLLRPHSMAGGAYGTLILLISWHTGAPLCDPLHLVAQVSRNRPAASAGTRNNVKCCFVCSRHLGSL